MLCGVPWAACTTEEFCFVAEQQEGRRIEGREFTMSTVLSQNGTVPTSDVKEQRDHEITMIDEDDDTDEDDDDRSATTTKLMLR